MDLWELERDTTVGSTRESFDFRDAGVPSREDFGDAPRFGELFLEFGEFLRDSGDWGGFGESSFRFSGEIRFGGLFSFTGDFL